MSGERAVVLGDGCVACGHVGVDDVWCHTPKPTIFGIHLAELFRDGVGFLNGFQVRVAHEYTLVRTRIVCKNNCDEKEVRVGVSAGGGGYESGSFDHQTFWPSHWHTGTPAHRHTATPSHRHAVTPTSPSTA